MDIKKLLGSLSREQLNKLAQADTVAALTSAAQALGLKLSCDECEVAFAALYPARGTKLSDEALELIIGGAAPKPTYIPPTPGGDTHL